MLIVLISLILGSRWGVFHFENIHIIDSEVQANLGPAIGVEEDEEDIVLEHKTIKKTQVE